MMHPEQLHFGQVPRSERELKLPDYALKELDMARAGYDLFGNQISRDQTQAIFDRWFGRVMDDPNNLEEIAKLLGQQK